MANSKMTKRDYFGMLKEIVKGSENEVELVAFIDHEIELLAKKSSKGKSKKKNAEQEELMTEILNALGMVKEPVTVSELQKAVPEMAEFSNQKLSAMLKKLVDNGEVVKTIDKKKSYFSLADTDTDEE